MGQGVFNETDLAKFFTRRGEGGVPVWDEDKIDHYYFYHVLRIDGVSTSNQRPLDVHRDKWCHGETLRPYYSFTKEALIKVHPQKKQKHPDLRRRSNPPPPLLQYGICIPNPDFEPLTLTPEMLNWDKKRFKAFVRSRPPRTTLGSRPGVAGHILGRNRL